MSQEELPLIAHLVELRRRLLRALLVVGGLFLALFAFANDIYHFLATPLLAALPQGGSMIATGVATPFFIPMKLTLFVAFFLAIPWVLYQIWAFVAPGLYKHERRLVLPLVISSALLFYLGLAFAYYAVFPVIFGFFSATAPEGVTVATDIANYLDFVLALFFAFGLVFEIPVAMILLCRSGVVAPDSLARKRPYVVVVAFVIGMLLTPPDVLSQTLLAIPICLLFELGLWLSRLTPPPRDPEEDAEHD